MADAYLRQSGLAHLKLASRTAADRGEAGVAMWEAPARTMVTLRGDPGDRGFSDAVKDVAGLDLPREPMTSTSDGDVSILWMGPDEWLVMAPIAARARIFGNLFRALDGMAAAATEVGDAIAVIGLSGPNARDVLAKGCTIDLHPRVFGSGRCVRTLLAKIGVTLHQIGAAPGFEIHVHRSYADYAWRWLEDAGQEYGVAILDGERLGIAGDAIGSATA